MQEQIEADIVSALKNGDKKTAEALRFLKSTIINARIKIGHDLSEAEVVNLIRKEIKLRQETKTIYAANNRPELAEKEEFEAGLFAKYVPVEISKDKILDIIKEVTKDLEAPLDFAKLMPAVIKKVAGRADGQTVATTVKEYLSKGI